MIEEGKKGVGGGVDGFVVRAWVPIERVVIAVMAAARAHTAPPRRGKEVFWSSGLLLLLLCRDPPSLVGLMTGSSVIESASRCSFCFSFPFPSFSFYSSTGYITIKDTTDLYSSVQCLCTIERRSFLYAHDVIIALCYYKCWKGPKNIFQVDVKWINILWSRI